jgi:hypothetical protein
MINVAIVPVTMVGPIIMTEGGATMVWAVLEVPTRSSHLVGVKV